MIEPSDPALSDAGKISFPDCLIREFHVTDHGLSFISSGIFIDGRGMIDAETKILCAAPRGVGCQRFVDDQWQDADPSSDGLSFIGEWSVEGPDLRFAGFETAGQWREYAVPAFSIRIIITPDQ